VGCGTNWGVRDSAVETEGHRGRGRVGGVPKKSVSRKCSLPRRGGPAESHREYYVGEGFLGETPPRRWKLTTQEGCDRTSCSVPTGADGVTAVGLPCTAVIDVTF
jgi:hypothetical protein